MTYFWVLFFVLAVAYFYSKERIKAGLNKPPQEDGKYLPEGSSTLDSREGEEIAEQTIFGENGSEPHQD